ncbi:hypothetical protein [Leptospira sanjuanensis]|uniref:hypothetical protein n=1 Tax=Leptospira sanjuanensis TaxID=2879643 RepID=UPI001EE8D548|nr:hypothetical protein [Leptospira sanjuanensis]MCG6167451.1 hypothetical protein [Leptospira sanjuanensis]
MTLLRKKNIYRLAIFFSLIPIVSLAADNIIKVRILSAEKASFLKEPDSYSYTRRAVSKDDMDGNAHVPYSGVFVYFRLFNPLNWRDRAVTIDSYDVLLENVRLTDAKDRVRTIESLLIRHITHRFPSWENQGAYDGYPNIKKYSVDVPDLDRDHTKVVLWYSDEPVLLADFTNRKQDRSRYVLLGHIHLYRLSDHLAQRIWIDYGRFGILFGENFKKKKPIYETNLCPSEDHR